ncbi:MAG: 4Fe-4S binding protein [Oscillospiraceae bacterium]|nr:4Fe-4S binding protein [Oscillospiraceae bacterium]
MAYSISETCSGCTACARLCPVMAISGERGRVHTINPKRCVECGVCARGCPKSAIRDARGAIPPRIPRKEWPKPAIRTEDCSACRMCVDICPFDALALTLPQFKGDIRVHAALSNPAKCVGCAQCMKICPLRLIEMQSPALPPEAKATAEAAK